MTEEEDRVDGIQSHDKDLAPIVFLYLEIPSSMQLLLCYALHVFLYFCILFFFLFISPNSFSYRPSYIGDV